MTVGHVLDTYFPSSALCSLSVKVEQVRTPACQKGTVGVFDMPARQGRQSLPVASPGKASKG